MLRRRGIARETVDWGAAGLLLAAVLAAGITSAGAGVNCNGLTYHGLSYNGAAYNGLGLNGLDANGFDVNGLHVDGLVVDGFWVNGLGLNDLDGLSALDAGAYGSFDSRGIHGNTQNNPNGCGSDPGPDRLPLPFGRLVLTQEEWKWVQHEGGQEGVPDPAALSTWPGEESLDRTQGKASAAEGEEPVRAGATVVSVKGAAQRLVSEGGKRKWVAVEAGQKLGELTVLRTGLGAKVELKFADGGRATVHSATKMGIAQLCDTAEISLTQLTLKHGSMYLSRSRSADGGAFLVETRRGMMQFVGGEGADRVRGSPGVANSMMAVVQGGPDPADGAELNIEVDGPAEGR